MMIRQAAPRLSPCIREKEEMMGVFTLFLQNNRQR